MADGLAILVPVLERPHRVGPLVDSIRATTEDCRIVFIVDPTDLPERAAVLKAGCECFLVNGGYAAKINTAVRGTQEPLVFLAADDLDFKPGWLEAATAKLSDEIQVVGVNDLLRRERQHATHFLMTREYAQQPTIDGGAGPLHEGYNHWWVDDELIATAKHRGAYAYARDAHVEHLHPQEGKAPDDETYRRGRARRRHDSRIFFRRRLLWT